MGRPVFRLSAIVAAAGAALFLPLLAAGVAADTKGPCTAGLAKPGWALTNTDSLDTPGSAFQVNKDEKVEAGMFSPFGGGAFTYHRVQLEFAGFRWTVSEKLDSGTDTEWRETVNVNDYAAFGVGLYKVIGYGRLAGGQDCIGTAYVKVTGRNPLTTAAGAAAAGATAVGVVAVAAAGAAGAGTKKPEEEVVDKIEEIAREEETQKELEKARQRAQELRQAPFYRVALLRMVFCSVAALPALLLTGVAMITEGGQPASPAPERGLPRLPWRPRISVVGILGGLLAGIGAVVLLQQYALVYPTRAVAIEGLAGGLAVGIIVPSLARILPVRRVNRRIGWLERRLKEAAARQSAGEGGTQG